MIREIYSREIVDLGVAPGSTYEIMREALLDTCDIRRVLLMYNLGHFAHQPNPWFGAALCRAANDWTIERWLPLDERIYGGIVVSPALPEEAAKEIRRLAGQPKLDAVLILGDPVGRGLGDPIHDPIFRAAAEADLSVVIHPTIEPTIGHPRNDERVCSHRSTCGGRSIRPAWSCMGSSSGTRPRVCSSRSSA